MCSLRTIVSRPRSPPSLLPPSSLPGAENVLIPDAHTVGISIAYWLSFGLAFVDHGLSAVRWRFLLAFQCIPAILLVAGIRLLPDSPRYLASVGRHSEAREVLEHIRGGSSAETDAELLAMAEEAQYNKGTSVVEFFKILVGKGSTSLHHNVARRAWLCIWLQIMGKLRPYLRSSHSPSIKGLSAPISFFSQTTLTLSSSFPVPALSFMDWYHRCDSVRFCLASPPLSWT